MKNFATNLFILSILFFLFSIYASAQQKILDDRVWSIVSIDPNQVKTILPDYNWLPVESSTIFYDYMDGITVGPNFRPKPTTNTTQSETSVDVHPTNNNIIFCSANATDWPVTGVYGSGVYWSTNGSVTWTGYDDPPFGGNSGDPASVIGADGKFYENFISGSGGQGVAVSTNNGINWTTYTIAPNPGSLADKNHYMVDKKSGSPYQNRSYCTWTDFGGTNDGQAVLRYSTNFGSTWSSTINLSGSLNPGSHAQGVNVQTGQNGEVYVTYAIYDAWPGGEDAIGFSKSTNGGVTWTHARIYSAVNFGIRGTLSSKSGIRVSSFPSMAVDRSGGTYNGTIYITWSQRGVSPAGSDPDIVYIKSTNGGINWTSPVRVNNDPINNGKDQYYPWCTVDQATGQFMIVFYDSRDVVNSQANVYMARSVDGGTSFENFKVSDQAHTPSPISGLAGGYAGDYIGVASYNDIAYPYWGDNRTGIYQGWMAKVTFGPPCPIGAPSNPNPVNLATNVPKSLSQLTWSNGTGTTQCEVWFGANANMTKVYEGSAITSWTINPPLNYNTSYNWQIINKDVTCSTAGPVWSFTTELSPGIIFTENFTNLNCWTAVGPLGTTNWSTQNTANAGGMSPELRLSWSPQFDGLSKLKSCNISVLPNRHYSITFKHMIDWYAVTAPSLGLGVSYDNGITYSPIWSIVPTANVGPETISASFITPSNASTMNLILFCNGNSFNIDYWYIDDLMLSDDDFSSIADPVNVSAAAISSSQVNVSFTPNGNNNNVVIVWNTTGTFTTPTGSPPSVGQPFVGGTLLYNGTSSPRQHTGLNPNTTYYYKLFSYNGTSYSPGVFVNATTMDYIQAAVDIILLVHDNTGLTSAINFGLDLTGTDGIDVALGEAELPGPPPGNGYYAAWLLPDEVTQSYYDYRAPGNPPAFPYTGNKQHVIKFQTTDFPITISWSLPSRIATTSTIVAALGGTAVSFSGIDSIVFTNPNTSVALVSIDYIDIDTVATFSFTITVVPDKWNMVSVPGTNPAGMGVDDWWLNFTGSVWSFNGTVYVDETLSPTTPGVGYWMKHDGVNTTYSYSDIEMVAHNAIPGHTNWNIIGVYEDPVAESGIQTNPIDQRTGTIWGFNGTTYVNMFGGMLQPGYGYWIKLLSACDIILEPPLGKVSGEVAEEYFKDDWGRITLTDASGISYTLYAVNGDSPNGGASVDLDQYEMPPVLPEGMFDIRFSSGRVAEDINSSVKTIDMQGITYPLTVRVEGMDMRIQDVTGKMINQNLKSGEDIIISNASIQKLMVTSELLPTVYALEQNYPNPFNPSTVIEFSLPEDVSNVKLSIYNALGEKVAELVNSSLSRGKYQYEWNARNVSTGIYFYELRTDKFISVKKMILMK